LTTLRRTSGPKKVEITGNWRKMYSEQLHALCSPANTYEVDQITEDGAERRHDFDRET
jgi:hypothetical protein